MLCGGDGGGCRMLERCETCCDAQSAFRFVNREHQIKRIEQFQNSSRHHGALRTSLHGNASYFLVGKHGNGLKVVKP